MSSLLTYNQYAAQALWGSSSGSGSSSLLDIIKSNMLDKASSLNKKLISKYETNASQLTNKIGYLDNLKSQLATLSTKAQNLTGLKNRVNANINVSSGSSSIVTITNDFIIKGQPAGTAGVTSKNKTAIQTNNYEGTFAAGDYTIKVEGNAVKANSSISFNNIKVNSSQIGSQKISQLVGYTNDLNTETITVKVGNQSSTIDIDNNMTINEFLSKFSSVKGIVSASIEPNGRINIQMDTSLGYQDINFTSSNKSDGNILDVLGLNTSTTKLSNGTIDTMNFQGFYATNFEEAGMDGYFKLQFGASSQDFGYGANIIVNISGTGKYDEIIEGTIDNGNNDAKTALMIVSEDLISINANLNRFIKTIDDGQFKLYSELDIDNTQGTTLSKYYNMSSYTMEIAFSDKQLATKLTSGTTYSYIDKNDLEHSYTVQYGDTVGTVLNKLGLLTSNNTVDLANINTSSSSLDSAFLTDLLGADFSTTSDSPEVTIKINAKTGADAPPVIKDKLMDYSVDYDSSHLISQGDLVINIDGVDNTFEINENTTVKEFETFMKGLGFTYDSNSKNFIGDSTTINKEIQVSGSSTIAKYMMKPIIDKYQYESNIAQDGYKNYYKNLSALGLNQDTTISINGVNIDIKKSWSIQDLSDAINNADLGVSSSIKNNDEYSDSLLTLTRTDNELSYIDITTQEDDDSGINEMLRNIGLYNDRYELDKDKQVLPDTLNITVTDKNGNSYAIGEITQSDVKDTSGNTTGVSFSTVVKNMSTNDTSVMIGSFNMDILKLGTHTVTVNDATAAVPDIKIPNLSGATNVIEMVEKTGTLSSNNYNLEITKINDNEMQLLVTDKDGNELPQINIQKDKNDNKFYYILTQQDEEGNEIGSVKFEIKDDEDFAIGDTRTTNIKIEATTSEGGSLEGIEDIINSVNAQIDENNKKIINEFVAAYNDVAEQVSKINKLSSTSTSYTEKLTINELVKGFNNIINQVDTTYGSTIGLTFGYDSSLNTSILKLDADRFLMALDENTETVTNYLSKVSNQITSSIDLFVKGKFASIYSNSNSKLEEYNNKISSLKDKNDKLMAKLESDYKIIEQMFNQSSNQYSELFAALS